MSCTSRFSIVTEAGGVSVGADFGRGVTGLGVTGGGVARGVGSGFGRGVGSGSGIARGFGFGFGVASGDGVAGTVRISSRALRNWRRFSASSSGRDCCARKPAPAITRTTTNNFNRTRTRRMLVQSHGGEKREVRGAGGRDSRRSFRGANMRSTPNTQHPMARPSSRQLHWMLDVGCWVLDVGCWMLGVGCFICRPTVSLRQLSFTLRRAALGMHRRPHILAQ